MGGRIGLAVSGGPDSMALLLLAHAALPGMVEAATVDHGLRPESADEAALVARVCARLGVPHATLVVEVAPGNLQDRARAARYDALGGWAEQRGLEALLTAHQLDDQAETLLMRLNRGSGLRGLAGIRARTSIAGHTSALLRPLLGWRRDELHAVVADAGLTAAADPSNADDRFDRVRIRLALAGANWIAVPGLARSAALLGEAEDVIAFAIGREFNECVTASGDGFAYAALRTGMPGLNLVRIGVIEAIARALGRSLDAGEAARMASSLVAGRPCNIGGIAARTAEENGERVWLFARENPRSTG
jgi:tRNA(Ile)-lysidine synthase